MKITSKIVWILNLTPDSFSGDWKIYNENELTDKIENLIKDWSEIIDVWAESTAPGSTEISFEEELKRLEIFFKIIKKFDKVIFSLDTIKSKIAEVWIKNWVKMINDVSGWRFDENMLPLISQNPEIKYVLMYGKNASWRADLEENTDKRDILEKMFEFFDERIEKMKKSWISRNQIILDTWMWAFISNDYLDSVKVLQNIQEIKNRYDLPIYIWTSRKWFLSKIVPDNWLQDRLWSSLSSSIYASLNWADFIRVHDVREVRQFIEVFNCLNTSLNDSN